MKPRIRKNHNDINCVLCSLRVCACVVCGSRLLFSNISSIVRVPAQRTGCILQSGLPYCVLNWSILIAFDSKKKKRQFKKCLCCGFFAVVLPPRVLWPWNTHSGLFESGRTFGDNFFNILFPRARPNHCVLLLVHRVLLICGESFGVAY